MRPDAQAHVAVSTSKCLSLREIADTTKRESAPAAQGRTHLEFHLVKPNRSEIMPDNGDGVTPSVRKLLADSHVSAIAVVVLLLISLGSLVHALLTLLPWILDSLLTAIAVHELPSVSFSVADRLMLTPPLADLFKAIVGFAAAWVLARCIYGVGPFRCLVPFRAASTRRNLG